MLKNNIEVDVKVKCIDDGVVNKTFVQMLEAFGYDSELIYLKRKE